MGAGTLISVDEYLRTSYSPDREYRDGVLVERNVGNNSHASLQTLFASFLTVRRKEWGIKAYTEFRIKVRDGWYPLPDVCVYTLPAPVEEVPSTLPLLWVEILSPDDRMVDVWEKAAELLKCG